MKASLSARAALAAVVLALGALAGPARAQDAPAGDAVNGKRVFLAVGCMYCHGRAGQGGAMNYPAPPLAKTELPFEGFKGVLRQSLRDMPAYVEAVLPDKEVADIYAFLQSLPGRRPAKDIAILNN
jgi:mono/diheme cytochrome c family protein